jgi:hypothetical protein
MMARGIKREQIGNHADPRDTSQMMAVDPLDGAEWTRSSRRTARTASRAIRAARLQRSAVRWLEQNIGRTVEMIKQSIAAR